MNRENIFFLPEGAPSTFARDEQLEKLPLPKLEATLDRYQRSLLPFGTEEELKNSRKVIDDFRNGVGKQLHKILEAKAAKERNWVRKTQEIKRMKLTACYTYLGRAILGRLGLSFTEIPAHALLKYGPGAYRRCCWHR